MAGRSPPIRCSWVHCPRLLAEMQMQTRAYWCVSKHGYSISFVRTHKRRHTHTNRYANQHREVRGQKGLRRGKGRGHRTERLRKESKTRAIRNSDSTRHQCISINSCKHRCYADDAVYPEHYPPPTTPAVENCLLHSEVRPAISLLPPHPPTLRP